MKSISKKISIIPHSEIPNSSISIEPSIKFIPDWYRSKKNKLAGYRTELQPESPWQTTATFKKCLPLLDAITAGYMAYLNVDIEVSHNDKGEQFFLWRTDEKIIGQQTPESASGVPVPEGYNSFVFKWNNPNEIKTPKQYSLLFTNPFNRFDLPFITISGIVDGDFYDNPINFPFFIKKDFAGIIEKGTPICQIIPIKRDNWKIEYGKYDKNKIDIKNNRFLSVIRRSYKNLYWQKKEYR